jgi:hypothetical protein
VQQLENSVIVPRVLGDAVDLPPLIVMTGVLVGGTVAGILGALLATPVIGTAREILRYVYRKMLGEDPFPPVAEAPAPTERPRVGLLQQLRGWVTRALPARPPAARKRKDAAPIPKSDADAERPR